MGRQYGHAAEYARRLLGDFGEEMSGGGHGGFKRAKEVIIRHIGAQPASNLLLQIELGGVAG